MRPDQVIATVLTYYYEAWRAGFERGQEALSKDTMGKELADKASKADIEKLAEAFVHSSSNKNNYIVKRFASWIKEKGVSVPNISEDDIRSFLDSYQRIRNISKNTYNSYKQLLKKFTKYMQDSLGETSES